MARIARAAGAERIIAVGTPPRWHDGRAGSPDEEAARFARFEADLASFDFAPNRGAVFSAHQMGSVRMGAEVRTHPCDPWGRVRDGGRADHVVRGLYVGDGSVFPTGDRREPDDHDHGAGAPRLADDPQRDVRVRPPSGARSPPTGVAVRLGRQVLGGSQHPPARGHDQRHGEHDDRAGDEGSRLDRLLEDDGAQDHGDDRVDVGIGRDERQRRLAQQPAVGREREEAADDRQVAERDQRRGRDVGDVEPSRTRPPRRTWRRGSGRRRASRRRPGRAGGAAGPRGATRTATRAPSRSARG